MAYQEINQKIAENKRKLADMLASQMYNIHEFNALRSELQELQQSLITK